MNQDKRKPITCETCGAKFKPGDRAIGRHRRNHEKDAEIELLRNALTATNEAAARLGVAFRSLAARRGFLKNETEILRVENARLARLVVSLGGVV